MHGQTTDKARNQHRFQVKAYGRGWYVTDSKRGRIVEFCDSKGAAVTLAAVLNGQLSSPAAWRRLEDDIVGADR